MPNRDMHSGKFRYPNKAMTPGEDSPSVTHLDLSNDSKPLTEHFKRGELKQEQGQHRESPGNTVPNSE